MVRKNRKKIAFNTAAKSATDDQKVAVREKLAESLKPFVLNPKQQEKVISVLEKSSVSYIAAPESLFWNFEDKVDAFLALLKCEGIVIDRADYVHACIKRPSLFTQGPVTLYANLMGGEVEGKHRRGIIPRINEQGVKISLKDYVEKICMKRPNLFGRDPASIYANLMGGEVEGEYREGIISRLERLDVKISLNDYVTRACLKQPYLLIEHPATIANHFGIILDHAKDLWDQGIEYPMVNRNTKENSNLALKDRLVDYVLNQPVVLSFGEDNLRLREFLADQRIQESKKANPDAKVQIPFAIYSGKGREAAEAAAIKRLGGTPGVVVPKLHDETGFDGKSPEEIAAIQKNLGLRTMVRAGIIKGELDETAPPSKAR